MVVVLECVVRINMLGSCERGVRLWVGGKRGWVRCSCVELYVRKMRGV